MSNVRKLPLWALSFLVVLGLHIGVALWAMFWQIKPPPLELPPAAPVMLAVLAPPPPPPPAPVPTPQVQVDTPPEPKLAEAPKAVLAVEKTKPKPKEKVEPPKKPVVKKVEPKKVEPPKAKPVETVAKKPSPVSDEKSTTESNSKVAAESSNSASSSAGGGAPRAGNSTSSGLDKVTWQGLLLSHLGQYKKYPDAAKRFERVGARRVNRLRFVINASGQVLSYELVGRSGNELLDQATIDMIQRAQPLPPPPPELLHNGVLEIVAPLVYELKR